MKYAFFKAEIKNVKEEETLSFGKGKLFFVLVQEKDEENYDLFLFSKSEEKFRTAKFTTCSSYYFKTNIFNALKKNILPYHCGYPYFYNAQNIDWDLTQVFESDDEKELENWTKENNIVLYKNYESDNREIKTIIKNNTFLSNFQIMDIVSDLNIKRVTRTTNDASPFGCGIDYIYDKDNYSTSETIFIYDKGFLEWIKEYTNRDGAYLNQTLSIPKSFFQNSYVYVQIRENSILLDKIEIYYCCEDDTLTIEADKKYSYRYTIGQNIICKKYLKTKEKDVSALEMFHINSQTIRNTNDRYFFEGAINEYDFFIKNEKFLSKCGMFKLLQDYTSRINNITSFMVLYLCLIQEYNIIELLVKMGHTNLVEDIFNLLYSSGTKDKINENVETLSQLINKETTKGTLALRIPPYIADYLKSQKAPLSTYLFWRDIYEIENISKENFEKFLNMPEKIIISSEVSDNGGRSWWNSTRWSDLDIQEIIKYDGYNLNKVFKYVYKIATTKIYDKRYCLSIFKDTFQMLKDTLVMAEQLNFELEQYPDNLYQIHNQLAKVIQEKKEKIQNEAVEKIAITCEKAIQEACESNAVTLPKKAIEQYCCVMPKNQQDFTQEGQQQHNCVAGYCSRVRQGECIIFFVREKNSPNDSYVTAEIRPSGLGQVMYSNNRRVPTDTLVYQYCKFICKTILRGVEKNEIIALDKLLQ